MKKISKSYKFKLCPTPAQKAALWQWTGTCRFLYNLALEHRILSWNQYRKNISEYDQSNCLSKMKSTEGFEWLKNPPSQALQQTLKDLNRAFEGFWKHGRGFPKFKKRYHKQAFRLPDGTSLMIQKLNRSKSAVKIPKIGEVKFLRSQVLKGRIRNATISCEAGEWHISFNCEMEINQVQNTRPGVGLDRGIAVSVQASSGGVFQLPVEKIKNIEKRIASNQRRLKNKKKFSNNWKKSQKQISKMHRRITRIRHDFLHKTSSALAKNHDLVAIEDLRIKNMSKSASGNLKEPGRNVSAKSGLNRSILRQGWGELARQLEYKCDWSGSALVKVDAKNSSRECSSCGHTCKSNRLSQEKFECLKCGHAENADLNASKVILARGHRVSACGGKIVGSPCETGTHQKSA